MSCDSRRACCEGIMADIDALIPFVVLFLVILVPFIRHCGRVSHCPHTRTCIEPCWRMGCPGGQIRRCLDCKHELAHKVPSLGERF